MTTDSHELTDAEPAPDAEPKHYEPDSRWAGYEPAVTNCAPAEPPDDLVRRLRNPDGVVSRASVRLDMAEAAARIVALQAECNAVQVELNAWRAQAYENMDAVVAQEIRAERTEAEARRINGDLARSEADNAALRAVVAAVVVKDGRIHCNDVCGVNWFDARAKLGEI